MTILPRRGFPAAIPLVPALLLPLCSCIQPPESTAEGRAEDIEFLARWARDCSPMVPVNERHLGLPRSEDLRPRYVELARRARDHREFLEAVFGYFNLLAVSGHGSIYTEESLRGLLAESRATGGKGMTDIPASQLRAGIFWSRTLDGLFVHPPFRIMKRGDAHFTLDPWRSIPRGSRISDVDGMDGASFLRHLEERTWLRHVAGDSGWIRKLLLVLPEEEGFRGWDIGFVLPDGAARRAFVPAQRGLPPPRPTEFLDHTRGNCVCLELGESIGYIRVKAMVHAFIEADRDRIRRFLEESGGRYEKLVIDVRGNGGGSTFYAYDTLIRPFLTRPAAYRQVSGVRRKFREGLGQSAVERLRGGISTWAWEVKVEPASPPPGFDPGEWIFYGIDREVRPSDPYQFRGRLHVLIDRGTGSAAETYADAVKRMGLGTLVGERTAGGLGNYFMAETLRLPHSGIILRMEADLDLNPDGSIQELAGTRPDVELEPGDLPETTSVEDLLGDPWIRRILGDPRGPAR